MNTSEHFTPDNIINKIDKIGAWSAYGLARIALKHYYPDYKKEIEENDVAVRVEVELMEKLGCETWQDLIIKFQKEVGYNASDFDDEFVNEY